MEYLWHTMNYHDVPRPFDPMLSYRPKYILVHEAALADAATEEILARLHDVPFRVVGDACAESELAPGRNSTDTLVLTHHLGKFLKPCQGAGAEMCCNYYVAGYAWNCAFDCTYCVLQGYLTDPALVIATNIDDYLREIGGELDRSPGKIFRIGTGELTDSLATDAVTHYSKRLVPFFARLPNGILELKTKSIEIANLEGLDHGGHTVISWSLNSHRVRASEESRAATIAERLAAAAQVAKWGYRLGFHFDPLVCYPGWEEEYREIVRELFATVEPSNIAWISLGALRFTPRLGEIIRQRHPKSRLPYGEFVPGHHGKLRYFRPVREEMYRRLRSWIHAMAPDVFVYLCMENRLCWERSGDNSPRDKEHLSDLLDACMMPRQPGYFM